GKITWYDFAVEIQKQAVAAGLLTKTDCVVNPCTTADYPTPAKRPAYSVLDKTKIQDALGIRLPAWEESLKKFLSDVAD
ncbi:MAG: sugar nucleotide-binding protein, partial [Treponema sp.]|nr:sugar nucleotide-binding protein [Treponema sp.]